MKSAAIILAAGQGKRMQTDVSKQYLLLKDRPVLYYTLEAFEKSCVDEVILVTGANETEYCRQEIVEQYGFQKVSRIVAGGRERYHSVARGMETIGTDCEYVLIHDGARPFVTPEIITQALEGAKKYEACVVAVPAKDTVRIADAQGFSAETPARASVWLMQTPQAFSFPVARESYRRLIEDEEKLKVQGVQITDDVMAVEFFTGKKAKFIMGTYSNIKITTPEDFLFAELLAEHV